MQHLAASGAFRLLPLENVNDIPGFRAMQLWKDDLPGLVPPEGVLAPATFAILAVRGQSPDWFVNNCLDALYGTNGVAGESGDVFSREEAAAWTDLNYHAVSERYFRAVRSASRR